MKAVSPLGEPPRRGDECVCVMSAGPADLLRCDNACGVAEIARTDGLANFGVAQRVVRRYRVKTVVRALRARIRIHCWASSRERPHAAVSPQDGRFSTRKRACNKPGGNGSSARRAVRSPSSCRQKPEAYSLEGSGFRFQALGNGGRDAPSTYILGFHDAPGQPESRAGWKKASALPRLPALQGSLWRDGWWMSGIHPTCTFVRCSVGLLTVRGL